MNTQQVMTNAQLVEQASAIGALAPISDVSDKYSFVPTLTAVDLLRDVGWFPIEAKQSSTRVSAHNGFQKHMIRFSSQEDFDTGKERIDLCLYNSHNRGCAFKLIASVWRKICGNGLMVASEFANFSHRHVGFSSESFIESASDIASSAGRIAEQIEDMSAIELTPDERGIYAEAAHSLIFKDPEKAPISPERLLVERRYDDKGKDLFTTANVIQENAMKGGLKGRTVGSNGRMRNATTRPIKAIDRDIKLNKALWTLSEKMMELKTQ